MAQQRASRQARREAQRALHRAERKTRHQPRWVVGALAAAFLVSGAAGLVHEVVWIRLLSRVFGVADLALATVLAAFMGGLALGSWAIGLRSARLADRVRAYAVLELGIGASALLLPLAVASIEPLYGLIWRHLHLSFAVFSLVRLVMVGALLLIPTVLMGATLPVLAEHLARVGGRGPTPAVLYTLNLVGAVGGVALAGFVLLPAIGIWGTVIVGALLNVGVGLGVLALPRLHEESAPATREAGGPALPPLLTLAAATSGALAMTTQVAWTRVLGLVVGSTTYALTAVLVVYLLALGLGAAWVARRPRTASRVTSELAIVHGLLALGLLGAMWAVNRLPYWYLQLYDVWGPEAAFGGAARALVAAGLVLAWPVVCAGTVLPLALVGAVPAGTPGTGPAVGRLYAINTLGAIVGALVTGFLLIPRWGTQLTLLGVAAAAALLALAFAARSDRARWLPVGAMAALALVAAAFVWRPAWNMQDLHAGVAEPVLLQGLEVERLTHPDETLLYSREGRAASVLVSRQVDGSRALLINARTNASDGPNDMATQVLLAQIPLLLAPGHERILIVGWGSGVTVGSATQSTAREIVAVELEPAVVEASRLFSHVNHDPLRDPRVRLHEDDARHLLLASPESYDVIISEPSHPWVPGVASLFTRDFYEVAARRLHADGVFAQWLQTYQTSTDTYRTLLATFQSVFPEVLVFRAVHASDTILIGSRRPLTLDLAELDRRWNAEPTRAELARRGLTTPEHVLASLFVGPAGVRELAHGAVLNTDDNMYVEFRGARDMARRRGDATQETFAMLEAHAIPIETALTEPAALVGSRTRLRALIEGRRMAERQPGRYEAMLPGS
jgi:spermidine synthase